MAFSMECGRFTSEIIITNEEYLKKKNVFLPVHHLKGFLIKSIVDYVGCDSGSQIIVCGALFSGKGCCQGQQNPYIYSALSAPEM